MSNVKYPNIDVQLTGEDGNAMFIIARVRKALKRNGVSTEELTEYTNESMSGDYDKVLTTASAWVNVS